MTTIKDIERAMALLDEHKETMSDATYLALSNDLLKKYKQLKKNILVNYIYNELLSAIITNPTSNNISLQHDDIQFDFRIIRHQTFRLSDTN